MPDLFTTELQNAVASAYVFCRKLKNLYSMGILWNRTAVWSARKRNENDGSNKSDKVEFSWLFSTKFTVHLSTREAILSAVKQHYLTLHGRFEVTLFSFLQLAKFRHRFLLRATVLIFSFSLTPTTIPNTSLVSLPQYCSFYLDPKKPHNWSHTSAIMYVKCTNVIINRKLQYSSWKKKARSCGSPSNQGHSI